MKKFTMIAAPTMKVKKTGAAAEPTGIAPRPPSRTRQREARARGKELHFGHHALTSFQRLDGRLGCARETIPEDDDHQ
jgi:hypothetical protein